MIHGCNHDHSDERKIYEKSYADKMIAIRMFREEGNKHFMAKEFSSAAVSYRRSLLYLDYTFAEKEKDDDEIDRERFKCHLNLAATKLDQMDFSEAIAQCRLALQIDSTSSKAHYRKGFAHLKRSEYYEAQEHLYKAMKLAASDTHENRRPIEDAIRDLNIKMRDYKKRSAEIAKSALK